MAKYIIGVDIGGTNTDAVIMNEGKVIAFVKAATTKDVTGGIIQSIQSILHKTSLQTSDIKSVMIGTTHFVNAVVQRSKELSPVAVLRLCGPASSSLPPFADFPVDLSELIYGHHWLLSGGFEYDGQEIAPVIESEVLNACTVLKEKNLSNIVVSGIFSSLNPAHEQKVAKLVLEHIPDARITLSHEVGFMGLLERENVSILNASIRPLAEKTIASMRKAMSDINLFAPFYLTQNDGTLVDSSAIEKYPVRTFASGVTNSMRGAAYLTGYKDALVVDIGGTSTDFGALKGGFPRPASATIEIGEVRTNFPMPDVFSIGLGGSIVDLDTFAVGPKSVGYELVTKALVFGGSVTTATDIVVALHGEQVGDPSKVAHLDKTKAQQIISIIENKVERGIEAIQTSSEDIPVILVGGGSILLNAGNKLAGMKVVKPKYHEVANAVGAAIAQVSSSKDLIITWTSETERAEKIETLKKEAIDGAIANGGSAASVTISEMAEIPVTCNMARIKVKAVANLHDIAEISPEPSVMTPQSSQPLKVHVAASKSEQPHATQVILEEGKPYKTSVYPAVHGEEWNLNEQDIDFIAVGAGILGAGGGFVPYYGSVEAKKLLKEGKKIVVIPPHHVKQGEIAIPCAYVGAPTIVVEKLESAEQLAKAVHALEKFAQQKASAILIAEIGGSNSMCPMVVAATIGLPVVDGDLMGRAFPECQMLTSFIYGLPCYPAALTDEKGNEVILSNITNFMLLEKILRKTCVEMGCLASLALPPIEGNDLQRVVIPYSLSKAWQIGKAVHKRGVRRQAKSVILQENGKLLFVGKITDLQRTVSGGFNVGTVKLQGLYEFAQQTAIIFQNENLLVKSIKKHQDGSTTEEVLAIVPDIISIVDAESGRNVHTEQIRYGLRVAVIGLPSHPMMASPAALKVVGPNAFGFGGIIARKNIFQFLSKLFDSK